MTRPSLIALFALLALTGLLAACQTAAPPPPVATPKPFAVQGLTSPSASDAPKKQQALRRATTAPVGQVVTWNNADTGDSGTVTPLRDFYAADGAYCREFQQVTVAGGAQRQDSGRACQQADASWKIVP